METEKKGIKDFSVGDMRGTYQIKWKSGNGLMQIWETSGGRFTVMNADMDTAIKSNFRDVESAKSYCESISGEVTALEKTKIKNTHSPYRIEKKNNKAKVREIGEICFGGWIYLGGGNKYCVWMSPTGVTFQVTTRDPEIAVTQPISQEKLHLFLKRVYEIEKEDTPYQMPFSREFFG